MPDLTSAFAEQLVVGYLSTAEGQAAAKKKIDDVLKSAVDSALGYGSAFRKQVEEAIAKALQLHQAIEIASYNDAILKIIERQLEHAAADAIERQVAGRMKELLCPAPAEIKLSELVEKYREFLKDKSSSGCVCHGESVMSFVHTSDRGFDHYGLDEDSGKSMYKCAIQFGIYKGKMYTLTFESAEVEKRLFVGPIYGFHRLLFQMKAANTTVDVDCTPADVELSYANHD